jgi:tRNA G10  N-methylase Trm11
MHIAILGRQPALGMAELEAVYGSEATRWFSDQSALIETDTFDIQKFGGIQKAGRVVTELNNGDWRRVSMKIVQAYTEAWNGFDGKITLGLSAYGFDVSSRDIQKTGIILKQKLKKQGVSLRLLPNSEPALNTAASHHNKLGLANNKVELLIVRSRSGRIVVAESTGSQNITAIALRDQGRPKRDAFVGMLPPKLAQIMINLAHPADDARILDPFCGTGVVLQEAALMGHAVYGTDLAEKMIRYTKDNLDWLRETHHITIYGEVHIGDAIETTWHAPIDAVVCETYLGQPFSAPPAPDKLSQVKRTCNQIISTFLENIGPQLKSGTTLCVAVPAWRDAGGNVTHLPLITELSQVGFKQVAFKNVKNSELLYYREDQVVARELLVLVKA